MTPTATIQPMTYHCPHCNTAVEAQPTHDDAVTVCPSCKQAFKLALPVAVPDGPAQPDIVLPPGVENPAETEPLMATAAADPPESAIDTIRLSMWRRYPLRCGAYVLGILAGSAIAFWMLSVDLPWMAAIVGIVVGYLLVRLIVWWMRMHNTTLTITDRRCVLETGLFTRATTEFGRKEIVDVHVSQGVLNRLLNVGDLVIVSNNGSKKELVVMAVPDPDSVAHKMAVPPQPPEPVPPPPPQATLVE